MKHVSILVTNNSLIAAVGNTRFMFSSVNNFLVEGGKLPMFNVQLVGLSDEVKLDEGVYSIRPDTTIYELEKTDLILIPPVSGAIREKCNKPYRDYLYSKNESGSC